MKLPQYPPWQHLPDHRKALYWFIMALQRREDYQDLVEKNVFAPCVIEGGVFRIRELEWIFRHLTQKVTVTKFFKFGGSQVGNPEVRIQDPIELNRTVKSGYDAKLYCISFNPGVAIELSKKQVEKKMLKERQRFFKQNLNVNEEMYLERRDSNGRLVHYNFDALEVSFQIFDLKKPPLGLSASEIAPLFNDQFDISTINKKAKSIDRLRKYALKAKTLSDFLIAG